MIACPGRLVNHKFSSPLRGRAVGLGDQFEQVAVGVVEIDAAAAIEVVDLARPLAAEVRVVRDAGGADARECGVELGFADQEGIMIRRRNGGWAVSSPSVAATGTRTLRSRPGRRTAKGRLFLHVCGNVNPGAAPAYPSSTPSTSRKGPIISP